MLRFLRISALPVVVLFFMCGNASADHRFGIGWSQWGALDDFDVGSVQATYQFGEVESIWDLRFGFTGFYSEFDTFFIGFGAMKEWGIGQNWSWGIGFDAGYYDGSRGLDELDNEIEFYSRILLNWHVSQSGFLRLEFGPGTMHVEFTFVRLDAAEPQAGFVEQPHPNPCRLQHVGRRFGNLAERRRQVASA